VSDPDTILAETQGAVRTLWLNRPEVKNAMSLAMVEELRTALAEAEAEPAIRVLVLRGKGGTFCAGGDIADMSKARQAVVEDGDDPIARVSTVFGELCLAYSRTPLALVTVVEGGALGGGFGLACVSDICIASQNASFGLPETSLGLVPAQIMPFLVERLGYSEAKRLAVLGGRIDAAEALRIELVHEMAQDVEAPLAATCTQILRNPPEALAATKELARLARSTPADEIVPIAARAFAKAFRGEEGVEGTTAFMEKRKPEWAVK
jgi:isohexenylglutaconyl-CoA hydratase